MIQLERQEAAIAVKTHILCTNLKTLYEVERVAPYLNAHKSVLRWSIDLHDWERVLKVISTSDLSIDAISDILSFAGFVGKELDD